MKSKNCKEIIQKIDELHSMHLSLRGILQHLAPNNNGKLELNWKTKIPSQNIQIIYKFTKPIDDITRAELNQLSDYLNQNFIFRLHSLLEYEGIKDSKTSIDKSLNGHEMIEFVHFLRKQFAHKIGKFNSDNVEDTILRERLFEAFNIKTEESLPDQFPLDKNRVILPIVEGIKKYVKAFCIKNKLELGE